MRKPGFLRAFALRAVYQLWFCPGFLTRYQKPVIVFVYGQQGLFGGVNLAGQKITERPSR